MKTLPFLASLVALAFAACSSGGTVNGNTSGSTTTAGSTSGASTTSTGSSTGGSTTGATTSTGTSTGSSTGSTGTTTGGTTGGTSSGTATGTGSSTGGTSSGSTTGGSWSELGAVADPGAASASYTQVVVPFPIPGGQEIVFGSGSRGIYGSSSQGDGGLSTPAVVFDAGGGIYLETLSAATFQQGTANIVSWVATGNGVFPGAMTQVDGGDFSGLDLSTLTTPLNSAIAYDQSTGVPWLVAATYNQTHLYIAPLDGSGNSYTPLNPDSGMTFPANYMAATPCQISDGGSAICIAFVSGYGELELWGGIFVPMTQQTQTTLFAVQPSGSPFTGVALTNLGNGSLAIAASVEATTAEQFAWATYSTIDTAPTLTMTDVTGASGAPGLFSWHNAPLLMYVDQSNFPYVERALALSGPAAPDLPPDAGYTKYPQGYSDDAGAVYIGLASVQLSEVQLLMLP